MCDVFLIVHYYCLCGGILAHNDSHIYTQVAFVKQQQIQRREKREDYSSPTDPGWRKQWSLVIIIL